mmetsp:Transcript_19889/g.53205  ORF Transcript_19889/g.53205 Transcript_19889/m.53205 type:complete len:186 (-) Transcript_19889:46-603(-)
MVKYSREAKNASRSAKAMGVDLRVHYKNTYEVGQAIRGRTLQDAQKYLNEVIQKKRCIPFRKYTGCIGRTPQAKEFKHTQGRWPVKSCKVVLDLLKNVESNAEVKGLNTDECVIWHINVHAAQHGRRRTYRAHGRINAFMSSPCHIELIVCEKEESVEKPQSDTRPVKLTKKVLARRRLKVGGDA